jgi:hypothetical protein
VAVAEVVGCGVGPAVACAEGRDVGAGPAVPLADGAGEADGVPGVPGVAGSQFTARSSLRRSLTMRSASPRLAAGRVPTTWERWYSGRFDTGMSVVS